MTADENHDGPTAEHADAMTRAQADLKLTCILLQYADGIERPQNIPLGMTMLGDLEKLRDLLIDEIGKTHAVFSEDETERSRQRTGYYVLIFSSIDDEALRLNQKYFPMPERPQGEQYACTEQRARAAAIEMAKKYLPSLYGIK